MSVYGNIINENKISISEFLDYVQESDNFTNSTLEKNEAGFVDGVFDGEYKEVDNSSKNKTIKERIISLWDKVITTIKNKVTELLNNISSFIKKHNFIDDFVKKYGKELKIEKINELKEKGWKGIPINTFSIWKVASLQNTYLNSTNGKCKSCVLLMDSILKCKDEDKINDLYSEFKDNVKEWKKETLEKEGSTNSIRKRIGTGNRSPLFIRSNDISEDGKYYYPNSRLLPPTINMAENGQSIIKHRFEDMLKYYNKYRKIAKCSKNDFKENENSEDKINLIKLKTKYEFSSTFTRMYILACRTTLNLLKSQYMNSIKVYVSIVRGIKKYGNKEEAK